MKNAVMFGAGNIGRGFIGKVFSQSGYRVCFLDIMQDIVDEFNARGSYPVRIVANEGGREELVENVYAVNSSTPEAVERIVACDIMATAVGVNVLPKIAPAIAQAVAGRMKTGRPLDIILCENQLGADEIMRGYIYESLNGEQRAWADGNLGLVEASIGRMVPALTPEMRAQDKLLICVEPFEELPVDRAAFKGELPALNGLVPFSPFGLYIERKLFVHNMGHATCAYLGYEAGREFIYQAAEDAAIRDAAAAAMRASAEALTRKYGEAHRGMLFDHVDDLLHRFCNHALKDPVARVGGDPVRKLRRNDRFIGAALCCMEHGVDASPIFAGIKAALAFCPPGDATAPALQDDLKRRGLEYVMAHYMGLKVDEPLFAAVQKAARG